MKIRKINKIISIILIVITLLTHSSCAHKSGHHGRDRISTNTENVSNQERLSDRTERRIGGHTKVEMRKENGVYLVPITVNDLNLDFIFDTGASSISISAAEATVMIRQGKITEDDIVGQAQYSDANGYVSVGTVILLRTVKIGDIILKNVEASVVDNIQAPLLLGQSALAKFGKVTINYNDNTIEFN